MTAAVEALDVVKRYRNSTRNAVDGIAFTVEAGGIVGILGPNGAGKSTLIKLICGTMPPTSGTLTVFGGNPVDSRVRRQLGAVHQAISFDMMLPVLDNLRIAAAFRGLRWRSVRGHVDDLLEAFDLVRCVKQLVFTLSGGQQRRLQVVRALLRIPDLLLLDEPTAGMDVAGRRLVWRLLDEIAAEHGTTVLWTSHNIDELERKCERVLVVHEGQLMQYASPRSLIDRFGQRDLSIRPSNADDVQRIMELAGQAGLSGRRGTEGVRLSAPDADDCLPALLATLHQHGIGIASVEMSRTSLEDVFMALTAGTDEKGKVRTAA
jgi:ABC-2 type transport system ATP-binding protein